MDNNNTNHSVNMHDATKHQKSGRKDKQGKSGNTNKNRKHQEPT